MLEINQIYNADCLEKMKDIPDKSVEEWRMVTKLYSRNSRWEKVKEYIFQNGVYYVSSLGRFMVKGKIKENKRDSVGTITYVLGNHRFKLHEIVLQTFLPEGNLDGYSPDHIDRSRRFDNSLSNLQWADRETQYSNRDNTSYKNKSVFCFQNNKLYNSCKEAEKELNLTHNTVARVARGERKSIHGYSFKFV